MRNAEDWTECTELTKSIETRSASASLGATHRAFAFYSEIPFSSIETRSAPALTRCCPGSFTFYLGNPISSILQNSVHSVEKRTLRICFNASRTLPRAQLQWCCLPHARWRCSYRVGGLRLSQIRSRPLGRGRCSECSGLGPG